MIGILAGILTTISAMPQALKTIKTRDVSGLSFWMYLTLVTGQILWLIHGTIIVDWGLILSNTISLIINGIIFFLIIKYQRQQHK
ncbi:SemiSWEET transporter [Aerococcus suis]|uniref:MtN3 and saliva related transmembrane protein n=1 Tax=Aerococcus suis TaxID=371602 RepID=A0A1W1Y2B7_9LACT|nr:SemiSWEET transporter [Aerococcus suis]MCI7240820.1 SemiSWEET transporter [Aerococcus suis]MDD7758263.1 SemiSWEET transporter [Aerococcus suis]MDY4647217.1 SemiSWEET transporter [Aerococcus suis]SMC30313.1 MtN3 and saliva related transmembrane protein [Aerococcus suis]